MPLPLSPLIAQTIAPPVMEARRWLAETPVPENFPLLNLSQAAPVDPPPQALKQAMAEAVMGDDAAHLYGPVLGLPALREEIAAQWSEAYAAQITPADVAVTSGCNQAFCAAIQALAAPGDNVLIPLPFYFNHQMWLTMAGVEPRYIPAGESLLPDPEVARALITENTRAIVLVSPNNPTGVEYPRALLTAFRNLAREHGLALIVDETYRDFHSQPGAPHTLFQDADWRDVLIHLYSFSKVFRLTGHRIGALIASPKLLAQVEKFLDSMTICPSQVGQRAALYGLQNLGDWVAGEREEILSRRAAVESAFEGLGDWKLLGSGAYFAYVRHPFEMSSAELAPKLLAERGLLVLPGTMFGPSRKDGGDGLPEQTLRIAFANADIFGIAELARRLDSFRV
ncbi:MAG: aminotransferase [Pseudomonadota bacterium]